MIHIYRRNISTGEIDWIGYFSDWYEAISRLIWLYSRDERDGEKCKYYYYCKEVNLGKNPVKARVKLRRTAKADEKEVRSKPETVIEFCPNCLNEVEIVWNVDKYGYEAYCPKCGERLMLCSECERREGSEWRCDYGGINGICHQIKPRKLDELTQKVMR